MKLIQIPQRKLERKDRGLSGQREKRSFGIQIKSLGETGIIEGYGAVFNNVDSWDDVIVPGAFLKSLAAHKSEGTMPVMLWQHADDSPIGVWLEMSEDNYGLKIKGQLCMDVAKGKEAYALLKMGAFNGLSIGFATKESTYNRETDVRTLTEIDLWEVSPVTFAANRKAKVTQVKSATELVAPKDAEQILRDAGFSKADATAYVSRVMRMGEERRDSAQSAAKAQQAALRLLSSLTQS
jgi:hypothetical protein